MDWYLAPSARAAGRRARASGWVVNGPEVVSFETEFADHVGARFGVAVASGATGVELALASLGLPRESRVLVSTLGSSGVVQAIVQAGHVPLLMDVSPTTGMPVAEHVHQAAAYARSSGHPAGAMVVGHAAGDPADVPVLAEAAGLRSDLVVQDASEGLGASLGGHCVGAAGTVCFSFYSSTNLPVGQGGMVTTEDPDVADRLQRSRLHGTSVRAWRRLLAAGVPTHDIREGGLDATLTDLSAAIGRGQLVHLRQWQRRRDRLAARYDARLAGIPGIVLPHRPATGTGQHAWHHYPVQVVAGSGQRDAVVSSLKAAGILTGEPAQPIHLRGYARDVCEAPAPRLPGAERFVDETVSLPAYPRLPDDAATRVADALNQVLGDASDGAPQQS